MENDLVKNNIKLVHYIVHKLGNLSKDLYEDYFQEGCYWLILAAERFDKSKGFAFSTFAANYIYIMVLDVISVKMEMTLMV